MVTPARGCSGAAWWAVWSVYTAAGNFEQRELVFEKDDAEANLLYTYPVGQRDVQITNA